MGDAGVTAQRYTLVLFGNNQQLELEFVAARNHAQRDACPFAWKPDTWYRLKLRVENTADGKTRIRGKAWPAAEAEPAAWLIDRVDPDSQPAGKPRTFLATPPTACFSTI